MNADLGARLLAAGLVTREELGLALSSVPAHGGALAAELVRQGVAEDAIAGFFVADGFGPVLGVVDLEAAGAVGRVPPQLAVDMLALPLRQSASGLVVAMADPSDVHAVRELTHAAGAVILPAVARIGALLEALFRYFPKETEAAAHRRERRPDAAPTELVHRRDSSSPPGASIEESFDAIMPLTQLANPAARDKVVRGRRRRKKTADFESVGVTRPQVQQPQDPKPVRRRRKTADFVRAQQRDTLNETVEAVEAVGAPELEDAVPGRDTMEQVGNLVGDPTDERAAGGGWGDLSEPTPAENIARRAARGFSILSRRLPATATATAAETVPRVSGGLREVGDLSAVLATIRAAKTRDEVCRQACLGLVPLGRCAVLLVLSRGMLKGREVAGGDLPRDAVQNLWIPTTSRSLLQRVVETGEAYLGPHGENSADAVFRAGLGSRGGDVLLMPVVLSGRTVAIVALDEPVADGVVLIERAELLTRAIAEAFRRLIMAAKG